MKICHRDLSPENLIMLENKSLIIDFGMCLRIPYSSDVRHLITPQTVRIYCDLILFLHFLLFLSSAHNIFIVFSALWKIGMFLTDVVIFTF
jgi:serine/threonine protein kinase